jgi:hypothetical protein
MTMKFVAFYMDIHNTIVFINILFKLQGKETCPSMVNFMPTLHTALHITDIA